MPRVIAGKRAEQKGGTHCSVMMAEGYEYREASRRWYGKVEMRNDYREVKVKRGGCRLLTADRTLLKVGEVSQSMGRNSSVGLMTTDAGP